MHPLISPAAEDVATKTYLSDNVTFPLLLLVTVEDFFKGFLKMSSEKSSLLTFSLNTSLLSYFFEIMACWSKNDILSLSRSSFTKGLSFSSSNAAVAYN